MFLRAGKQALLLGLLSLTAASVSAATYTVKPGEYIELIAARLDIPLSTLKRANPGLGSVLQPGQKIHLPGSAASHLSGHHRIQVASSKPARVDHKIRQLKAQLAQWVAYKKALARKNKQSRVMMARAQKQKRLSRRKRQQFAEWTAYKHAVAVKKRQRLMAKWEAWQEHLARARAKKRPRLLAQSEDSRRDSRQISRGSFRRMTLASNGAPVVRTALSYRGASYVFGANGEGGAFDCSSFTRRVYGRAGVSLPRTSREQYACGDDIPRSKLKPGDLLFFHTNRPGVSHVGIYAGNGRFVHAANPRRGVTTDSLDSGFYRSHFVGARRVHRRG